MGFNSGGAIQGGMSGAAAGGQIGGGWGALIGGVLGAAGGSQLPEGGGTVGGMPYLPQYTNPGAVSSQFGGSYIDPYSGRIVYSQTPMDMSQYGQNAAYGSMLNDLLGIGGGAADQGYQLDQQMKQIQQQLDAMNNYKGLDAKKYLGAFAPDVVNADGSAKSLNDITKDVDVNGPLFQAFLQNMQISLPRDANGKVLLPKDAAGSSFQGQFAANNPHGKNPKTGADIAMAYNVYGDWDKWVQHHYKNELKSQIEAYNKAQQQDQDRKSVV